VSAVLTRALRFLARSQEDLRKQVAKGTDGKATETITRELQLFYTENGKVYCLRARTVRDRDEWFDAIERQIRLHHRRRAVRAITSGHMPDPDELIPQSCREQPTMDRFSFKEIQGWADESADKEQISGASPSIRRLGNDWDEYRLERTTSEEDRERTAAEIDGKLPTSPITFAQVERERESRDSDSPGSSHSPGRGGGEATPPAVGLPRTQSESPASLAGRARKKWRGARTRSQRLLGSELTQVSYSSARCSALAPCTGFP
jgi:hypothetical protein